MPLHKRLESRPDIFAISEDFIPLRLLSACPKAALAEPSYRPAGRYPGGNRGGIQLLQLVCIPGFRIPDITVGRMTKLKNKGFRTDTI
jgi:hypothetical protein